MCVVVISIVTFRVGEHCDMHKPSLIRICHSSEEVIWLTLGHKYCLKWCWNVNDSDRWCQTHWPLRIAHSNNIWDIYLLPNAIHFSVVPIFLSLTKLYYLFECDRNKTETTYFQTSNWIEWIHLRTSEWVMTDEIRE